MDVSNYFQRDQVSVPDTGDDADLRRPAGGGEHVAGSGQVGGDDACPEPHLDPLPVCGGRRGQDDGQFAAPGLHPCVRAAGQEPVRRDQAPCQRDGPLAGRRQAQQCCACRQPGPRGDSESDEASGAGYEGGQPRKAGHDGEFPAPAPAQLERPGPPRFGEGRLEAGHQAGIVPAARAPGGRHASPPLGQPAGGS